MTTIGKLPGLALCLFLSLQAFNPVASALPEPAPLSAAPASCTVTDSTSTTCTFACLSGAAVTVKASNANHMMDQQFTASCGGAHASCTAKPDESCSDDDKASSAGEGLCKMESKGKGSAICSSSGGEEPTGCLEDPFNCLCPPWVCGEVPNVPQPGDLGRIDPNCLREKLATVTDNVKVEDPDGVAVEFPGKSAGPSSVAPACSDE